MQTLIGKKHRKCLNFPHYFFCKTESVIKRRLLIDGDGTGDDRRLNVLLKSFIKWSNTKDTPENT